MDSNSWLLLEREDPGRALGAGLRARDALNGRDCGWLEQMEPFVRQYARPGELVLDPFCGFGTTLLAASMDQRRGLGYEIDPARAALARERLAGRVGLDVRTGSIAGATDLPEVDLCLTSVPYFGCGARPGDAPDQLYAAADYQAYLAGLRDVFHRVRDALRPGGYCIAMAENLQLGDTTVPLAFDLARVLGALFTLRQERILLYRKPAQALAPGTHASNRAHEYALVFQQSRGRIDPADATALVQALAASGHTFAVWGSFADWLGDPGRAPAPADLDLLVDPASPALGGVLAVLAAQGFELTCWGDPVALPVSAAEWTGRWYFRGRRVRPGGAVLQVDVTFELVGGASVAATIARCEPRDGLRLIATPVAPAWRKKGSE